MFDRDEQQRLSGWDANFGLREDFCYVLGTKGVALGNVSLWSELAAR